MPWLLQPSFAAGELAPSLAARVDLAKYRTGAQTLLNFMVHPHGGVSNRPGTRFVAQAAGAARLIPFQFNVEQTYVLEFSDLKMRIIKDDGIVIWPPGTEPHAGEIVNVVSPYAYADLALLKFVQTADTLYLAHPSYPIYKLTRTSHYDWTFTQMTFSVSILAPASVTATAVNGLAGSAVNISYRVSALSDNGEESYGSTVVTVGTAAVWPSGGQVHVGWAAVTGATSYNIYKSATGEWGLIGTVQGNATVTFTDDNIAPNTAYGIQEPANPFNGAGNYPGVIGLYQQRLAFARTNNQPQTLWFSRSGAPNNMASAYPLQADDAIEATLDSRQVNEIRHIVPMDNLIVFTSGGEWVFGHGSNTDVLTPTSISAQPQGYRGCSNASPIVVGRSIFFVQRAGGTVREIAYQLQANGLVSTDVSILANHLFQDHTILDWAYQQAPDSVVWSVRDDGVLLGFTFIKEQEVWAWHRHTTAGQFQSICTISGPIQDEIYFLVKRHIGGTDRYYVEKLCQRLPLGNLVDGVFLDASLTYNGAPATTISGLDHLEAQRVSALADGNVYDNLLVSMGAITLPMPASVVHVGLPYTADLQTMSLELEDNGTAQGRKKKIARLVLRLLNTVGILVGPSVDDLVEQKWRQDENYNEATQLFTGDKPVVITPSWKTDGVVFIRQAEPLPVTVLGIVPEVVVGEK